VSIDGGGSRHIETRRYLHGKEKGQFLNKLATTRGEYLNRETGLKDGGGRHPEKGWGRSKKSKKGQKGGQWKKRLRRDGEKPSMPKRRGNMC